MPPTPDPVATSHRLRSEQRIDARTIVQFGNGIGAACRNRWLNPDR
jgi:hypothetical protein